MTNQNIVELDVQLELRDYLRANYWYLFNRMGFRWLLGLAIVMLPLTGLAALFIPDWSGLFVPLTLPLLVLVVFVGVYFKARNAMMSNKGLQQMIHYRFSPAGIDAEGPSSSGHVNWELLFQAVETKHNFLIFIARNLMYTIPKRCFQDSQQIEEFRELIREHLAEKAKFLLL
jgi:hypothetical protein